MHSTARVGLTCKNVSSGRLREGILRYGYRHRHTHTTPSAIHPFNHTPQQEHRNSNRNHGSPAHLPTQYQYQQPDHPVTYPHYPPFPSTTPSILHDSPVQVQVLDEEDVVRPLEVAREGVGDEELAREEEVHAQVHGVGGVLGGGTNMREGGKEEKRNERDVGTIK